MVVPYMNPPWQEEGIWGRTCLDAWPSYLERVCPIEKIISDLSFQPPFPWKFPAPTNLTLLFTAAHDLSPKPAAMDLLGDLHKLGLWWGRPAQMLQFIYWGRQDTLIFFSWPYDATPWGSSGSWKAGSLSSSFCPSGNHGGGCFITNFIPQVTRKSNGCLVGSPWQWRK